MIYVADAIDLFSDGSMIGVGSVVSIGLTCILALGQIMADVPEDFVTIANLKEKARPAAAASSCPPPTSFPASWAPASTTGCCGQAKR